MSPLDQSDLKDAPRKFLGRPVVLVCDDCARVQDGLTAADPEEQWADQPTYMTARRFSPEGVWWYHTTCQTCREAAAEKPETPTASE